ncbi:hypothetical protein HDK77DRAFT_154927 [Phyllosticta capitalensis]|uniref:Uncharacterized protein n=1 Tax=Phyllosticta capitalensis TaxID=121624 RepID=A0ABR1YTG9_9PEZI
MNSTLTLLRRPLRPQYIIARPLTFVRARSAAATLKADQKGEAHSPRSRTAKSKPAAQQASASGAAQRVKAGSTSNSTRTSNSKEDEEAAAARQQARSNKAMEHARQWQRQQQAEEEAKKRQQQQQQRKGEMKEEYKPTYRRVLAAIVAAPVAIVSSWMLYERGKCHSSFQSPVFFVQWVRRVARGTQTDSLVVVLGKEQRARPEAPEGAAGDAGVGPAAAR